MLNLFLLSELTVSMIYVQSDSPGIPCNITYAEKLFKKIFGRFLPEPPKNVEEEDKFNEAKGKFRAIFPGKNIYYVPLKVILSKSFYNCLVIKVNDTDNSTTIVLCCQVAKIEIFRLRRFFFRNLQTVLKNVFRF